MPCCTQHICIDAKQEQKKKSVDKKSKSLRKTQNLFLLFFSFSESLAVLHAEDSSVGSPASHLFI